MNRREIESEIQQKNYKQELLLCQKAGGDIEKYRRLSFDVLQLEQIRRGLENGIDVESYLDPRKSWLEMEEIRISLETGFDMQYYTAQGYDWLQCNEIRAGIQAGLDVSCYCDVNYLAPQMKEIRKGLRRGIDVSFYASPRFDWFQMHEIRRGLEEKLDVSVYAKPAYKHGTMRAIRLGLKDGIDLVPYAQKGYSGTVLEEIGRGIRMNYDICKYLEEGYDAEQLKQINLAHECGVNLLPYLSKDIHGVQLQEILTGLKEGLDVSPYASVSFNWFQMREIRYGLESRIDVTSYASPEFSPKQMEVIRKGLIEGLDVSRYAKVYYEPEQMEEIRCQLEEDGTQLTGEMEQLLRHTMEEEPLPEEAEPEEMQEDFVLDSCVAVSEDKMSVSLHFGVIKDVMAEKLAAFTVADVLKLLKRHDVKQGIYRERIEKYIREKQYDKEIVVAEGKAAVEGQDGKFKFYFRKELNRRPRVLEDGSVDYKSMELFEPVKKDMLLAEYVPASPGVFGYDVTGSLIKPKQGKELPPLRGDGFRMTDDKKQYYSLMDGIVELEDQEQKLMIRNLYTVNGDVDASVGNIQFHGDVNITGHVHSGFSVVATGSIVIDGHCGGSQIEAGRDVIIRKGCQGRGIGKITAGGGITGQFFESVTLSASGDVEASYLLNCQLRTEGKLLVEGKKGVIIGGYTCAKQGVSCFGIGNIAEIKTTVEVGIDKEDMAAHQELQKKIDKVEAELKTCEAALHRWLQQPERDDRAAALVDRLTKAVYTQKKTKKDLLKERVTQMERMTKQREARIQVSGRVFPGTLLYMNTEPYIVKDTWTNVDFVTRDNRVDTVMR